jgi:hypothetical protein
MKRSFLNNPCILICLFLLFTLDATSQIRSPQNLKLFADHLFCTADYLRAVDEYRNYLSYGQEDTAEFKLLVSLSEIKRYDEADHLVSWMGGNKTFYMSAQHIRLKNILMQKDYYRLRSEYSGLSEPTNEQLKLRNFTYLYTGIDSLASLPYINLPFDEAEKNDIKILYDRKLNLSKKDPWKAGTLSALFPGAGKIYTEEYGDALFTALAVGTFGYLAYTNYKAGHDLRTILFSGITAWFYGGGIYGAAASAHIYNLKVEFSFISLLDSFISNRNYFLSLPEFCK